MMAAYAAAKNGCETTLLEKNEKLGKKLYITGKGRCNITNAADIADFFDNVVTNRTFLYSAFYTFSNTQLIDLLGEHGLRTKTERGGRVFPVSDKSSDVIKALSKALDTAGVRIRLNADVERVMVENNTVKGVACAGEILSFDRVVVATGGVSYASTGCTGDGYRFAKMTGHHVTDTSASLVGVDTADDVSGMAGLTLKNVKLTLKKDNKMVFSQQGEMLFTHTGISGPLVLSASAYMTDGIYAADIDLKPALNGATLDTRLVRDLRERSNQDFANVLTGLLPKKLIGFVVNQTGIDGGKKAHSITKQERKRLGQVLKCLTLEIKEKRPIREAVITRGGVDVKQIDASTMQSKIIDGLYFAGEVMDVDALTGGYNLQIAFSTGYLAGSSIDKPE